MSLRRFDYRLNQLQLNSSREPVVAEKLPHVECRVRTATKRLDYTHAEWLTR